MLCRFLGAEAKSSKLEKLEPPASWKAGRAGNLVRLEQAASCKLRSSTFPKPELNKNLT
jgi:hypothetical protein